MVTLGVTSVSLPDPAVRVALANWMTLPYIFAGLIAWWRRPDSRFGPLMVAAGFAGFLSTLTWSDVGILGFESTAGIDAFLPIFMFVILFGLSMDYHVFIISRIREAYDRGMSTEEAVTYGIKTTAGVVTSAALVMVCVFAVFATLSLLIFKQFGVGLAAAILIDATIVRAILLPATMKLLGDWNWYLPKWLEWLPHLDHGETLEPVKAPAALRPSA
jgi:RND superfamily putative drug exporter